MAAVYLFLAFNLLSLSSADIKGIWFNPEKTRSIRIFEQNGKYYGIMHWIGEPEPKLSKGQVVLKNLVYENGHFVNGLAYTPAYGWVECEAKLEQNKLHLTGHRWGITRTRIFVKNTN